MVGLCEADRILLAEENSARPALHGVNHEFQSAAVQAGCHIG